MNTIRTVGCVPNSIPRVHACYGLPGLSVIKRELDAGEATAIIIGSTVESDGSLDPIWEGCVNCRQGRDRIHIEGLFNRMRQTRFIARMELDGVLPIGKNHRVGVRGLRTAV